MNTLELMIQKALKERGYFCDSAQAEEIRSCLDRVNSAREEGQDIYTIEQWLEDTEKHYPHLLEPDDITYYKAIGVVYEFIQRGLTSSQIVAKLNTETLPDVPENMVFIDILTYLIKFYLEKTEVKKNDQTGT